MKVVTLDIETDGLNPSVIWCIVTKELDKEYKVWSLNYNEFKEYIKTADLVVAHNGLGFDIPVINRLLGKCIKPEKVIDTFVVSRLVNYSRFNTHGLEELGQFLGYPKGNFNDWSQLSDEMITYCKQDVTITEKVYKMYEKYIWDSEWSKSMRLEHDMVLINNEMTANGFLFDKDKAVPMLAAIKERMAVLEDVFQQIWPPEIKEVNRVQYRVKKDGELYSTVQRAIDTYPKTWMDGGELVCGDYITFNPGSPKDRIEKLWEAGWKPIERTKTHNEFIRDAEVGKFWRKTKLTPELYEEKRAHFATYGWTVGDTNLRTLPESAPEGASRLAEWLTLEGRRSSLTEWLSAVQEDSRIHGKFWNIGAWTHRMSHSNPNQANIFSPFHGTPTNAVEQVKADYDRDLRALWTTDKVLVGTDADSIQLRILAHYMRSEAYREAILSGRKEDETDIHNLNKRALGLDHLIRDDAKTFIYAWLLGAANAKIASILRCSTILARQAEQNFLESLPELKKIKRGMIPRDARRGYFVGLDGRKVLCDSEHLMLAGYLQNGEAIAMKMWIREWKKRMDRRKIWYRLVDFVHDEVQVEVNSEADAARLIQIQKDSMEWVSRELNLFCPLEISANIGYNWSETH